MTTPAPINTFNNQGLISIDYINKGINDLISSYINLDKLSHKPNIKTLCFGIIGLIGIDLFKSLVKDILFEHKKEIPNLTKSFFVFISDFIKKYYQKLKYFVIRNFNYVIHFINKILIKLKLKRVVPQTTEIINYNYQKTITFNCEMTEDFVSQLKTFLTKNPDSKFNVYYDNNIKISSDKFELGKHFHDIDINYSNINITINSLSSSIDDELDKKLNKFMFYFSNIDKMYPPQNNVSIEDVGKMIYMFKYVYIQTGFKIECEIKKTFLKKFLSKLKITFNGCFDDNIKKILMHYIFMLHDCNLKEYFGDNIKWLIIPKIPSGCTNFSPTWLSKNKNATEWLKPEEYGLIPNPDFDPAKTETKSSEKKEIKITIKQSKTSETDLTEKQLVETFEKFKDHVINFNKKSNNTNTVNIFNISLKQIENKTITDNPDYVSYMEEYKKLTEAKTADDVIIRCLGSKPPKNIVNTTIEDKIECDKINTKNSNFSNLYLRNKQDEELLTIVDGFKNDKDRLKELGIPNKLGIMLYGEPGTGKTTCISTIATFMGRDIFYLNLNGITTNSQLKMLFDYVNVKHSGGGVIVLEDIDAMTDIIYTRDNIETTKPKQTGDNKLTLEYFLNLLDGVLTYDDSVVIITTNYIDRIDPALYRSGRMDKCIEMKKADHYQIKKIFIKFIGRNINNDVLELIPEDKFTPADIIFHLKNYVKKTELTDSEIMAKFISEPLTISYS
jgi:chaperone BCS1